VSRDIAELVDVYGVGQARGHVALGAAFKKALGERKGIKRYGFAYAPLDEVSSWNEAVTKKLGLVPSCH
jgi:hypothetical protein